MSLSKPNGRLKPDPHNARKHGERNQALIKASLQEVGGFRSIAVDGDNIIRAGNGVYEQAQALGMTVRVIEAEANELIAVRRKDLKGKKAERAALLDNRAGELSEWDDVVIAELAANERKMLDGMWSDKELRELIGNEAAMGGAPEPQIDRAAELQAKWQVARGDVWQIGRHRLMCGDSTSKEDVARLMDGAKASITFTSPPYNVGKNATLSPHQPNGSKYRDDLDDRTESDYLTLLLSFTNLCLESSAYVFVNVQSVANNKLALIDYLSAMKDRYADTLVWDKMNAQPAMAENVVNSRFEFVHCFSEKANRAIGTREFRGTVDNVIAIASHQDKQFASVHSATFPVELVQFMLSRFTAEGDSALDPFTGSGTTLVACEQLGRIGYGMEIEPKYCAVTLERLSAMGLTPERVTVSDK